jgi:hypothetical protein
MNSSRKDLCVYQEPQYQERFHAMEFLLESRSAVARMVNLIDRNRSLNRGFEGCPLLDTGYFFFQARSYAAAGII